MIDKFAIHGFGRIGRSALKAALKYDLFSPVAVFDIRDAPMFAALVAADSNYGYWQCWMRRRLDATNLTARQLMFSWNARSSSDGSSALGVSQFHRRFFTTAKNRRQP